MPLNDVRTSLTGRTSRRRLLQYSAASFGAIALGPTVTACGGDSESKSEGDSKFDLINKIKNRGHAKLGIVDSRPGSYTKDGKVLGQYPGIVKAILKKHGVHDFKAFEADFEAMVSGLQADKFDICCAGLLITDERCKAVAMSTAVDVLTYEFAVKRLFAVEGVERFGASVPV